LNFMRLRPAATHAASLTFARIATAQDARAALGGWVAPVIPHRSRWLLGALALGGAALFATWLGIRTLPWFGPLLADNLRTFLGSENVTRLEETLAGVEDHVQHAVSRGEARSLSDATPSELLPTVTAEAPPLEVERRPSPLGPMYSTVTTAEDGIWQPVEARATPNTVLYRTIVHPDPERVYAELFVFALDLSAVRVHAVAGSIEPKSAEPRPDIARPGVIPESDREHLIAAFNGGFKAEHGQFGMMVDGKELLAPRRTSCTFAGLSDGSLRIGPWTALAAGAADYSFWRQAPGCMVEQGALHPGLSDVDSRRWGATLEGGTVIRRSAVGLSADRQTLFVGISNSTTARALAMGMRHAGAADVAQLDVNFSYPRFLVYREQPEAGLVAIGAVKGQLFERDEYLGHASTRDFFYVTAK
jgi:hypothetical protein